MQVQQSVVVTQQGSPSAMVPRSDSHTQSSLIGVTSMNVQPSG